MKIVIQTNHIDFTGGGKYSVQLATSFSEFGNVYFKGNFFNDSKLIGQNINIKKYDNSFEPDIFIAISHFGGIQPIGKINIHVCMFPLTSSIHPQMEDTFKLYDYAICLNEFVEEEQKQKWGLDSFIINPYVDDDVFESGDKEDIILNVGNYFYLPQEYNNSKNQHLVIDWFIKNNLYKKYKLIMTGSIITPHYYDGLLKKTKKSYFDYQKNKLIVKDYNIEILNNVPFNRLVELYSKSKYLVHAMGFNSRNNYATEHFGIVAIEAMASGCQPIVHNSGGCKDIDGVRVWNDFNDIIPLMKETEPKQLQELAKRYSFENTLKQTGKFLESIKVNRQRKIPPRLHIGCGNDYKVGYWNVDIADCRKDQYIDITERMPFEDDYFDYIYAQQVLEHIPKEKFFEIFKEIHRIMKDGGVLEFQVPQAGSDNFWTDPTHTMPFTARTMDFIIKGKVLRENGILYGADYEFLELERPKIDNVKTLYFKLAKVTK